jgi:PqqD family protein of HPr-rel-A system
MSDAWHQRTPLGPSAVRTELDGLGQRPRPCPAVRAYPLDDELVVYDPRQHQGYVLNRTAALIWACCDGSRTVEEVANVVARRHALTDREALTDVEACLQDLHRAGLLAL